MSFERADDSFHPSRRDFARMLGLGAAATLFGGAFSRLLAAPAGAPTTGPAGMQGAGYYGFALGEARVTMVSDGGFAMQPRVMFPGTPEAAIVEACRVAHVSPDGYPGQVNVALIERGDIRLIVDTGCGKLFGPTTGFLVPNLRRAGVEPESITHVALTHAHPDHIGGLLDASGRPTFANARVFANRAEHDFWTGNPTMPKDTPFPAAMIQMMIDSARAAFAGVKDRLELFMPGDSVAGLLTAVDAPGHTPGHVAFTAGEGDRALMLLGDSIHIFALQMAHPEWHISFDRDGAQAEASRRMLLAMAAKSGAITTAAHAPFPPAGFVDADGGAFRWTSRPWEW